MVLDSTLDLRKTDLSMLQHLRRDRLLVVTREVVRRHGRAQGPA
jgi:hypothetical protein